MKKILHFQSGDVQLQTREPHSFIWCQKEAGYSAVCMDRGSYGKSEIMGLTMETPSVYKPAIS